MAFQVPQSKASIKQNVFEFQLPGSKKKWVIPKARYIQADLLQQMQTQVMILRPIIERNENPTPEQALALTEIQQRILEHYCPGLMQLIDSDQMMAILQEWQRSSSEGVQGIELGES